MDVDKNWDAWAYHLPFAARLWGLATPETFPLSEYLQARYDGFALFGEFLQGFFWSITGRPESANLVSFLSLVIYIYFLRNKFKIPIYLSTIALLAIPIVQVHATSSYVDLPGSIAMSVLVMMTLSLYLKPEEFSRKDLLILLLGAACAANIRLKLNPMVFLVLCAAIPKIFLSIHRKENTRRKGKTKFLLKISALFIGLAIVFTTPIKNAFYHHNPFYPVKIAVDSIILNHTEDPVPDPKFHGRETSRPERWLYSIFEIIPRPFFRGQWSIDQYSKGLGNRYGGFLGIYVLFNLLLFIYLAYRNWSRDSKVAAILLAVMSLITMIMPSSPRLRYYLYWMIVLVSLNLWMTCQYSRLGTLPKLVKPFSLGLAVGLAFMAVVICTRGKFVRPFFYSFDTFMEKRVDRSLMTTHDGGRSFCVSIERKRFLILYSSTFNPPLKYSIRHCDDWGDKRGDRINGATHRLIGGRNVGRRIQHKAYYQTSPTIR